VKAELLRRALAEAPDPVAEVVNDAPADAVITLQTFRGMFKNLREAHAFVLGLGVGDPRVRLEEPEAAWRKLYEVALAHERSTAQPVADNPAEPTFTERTLFAALCKMRGGGPNHEPPQRRGTRWDRFF